jgi:hypothetical protein
MKSLNTSCVVSLALVTASLLQHLSAAEPLAIADHGQRSTWFSKNSERALEL